MPPAGSLGERRAFIQHHNRPTQVPSGSATQVCPKVSRQTLGNYFFANNSSPTRSFPGPSAIFQMKFN